MVTLPPCLPPCGLTAPLPAELPPPLSSPPQPATTRSERVATTARRTRLIEGTSFRIGIGASLGRTRIQGVLQPVADKVEREHRQQQCNAGEGHVPPRRVEHVD